MRKTMRLAAPLPLPWDARNYYVLLLLLLLLRTPLLGWNRKKNARQSICSAGPTGDWLGPLYGVGNMLPKHNADGAFKILSPDLRSTGARPRQETRISRIPRGILVLRNRTISGMYMDGSHSARRTGGAELGRQKGPLLSRPLYTVLAVLCRPQGNIACQSILGGQTTM